MSISRAKGLKTANLPQSFATELLHLDP